MTVEWDLSEWLSDVPMGDFLYGAIGRIALLVKAGVIECPVGVVWVQRGVIE